MKNIIIHRFKIAVACLLGWIMAKEVLHFPSPQIVIISSLLVLQSADDFGRALTKSYMRAIGALAGAGISWLILNQWDSWGHHPYRDYGIFFIVIFIFGLLSQITKKYQAAGLFGVLTIASILINPHPNHEFVYIRLIEILFGIGIALCVSGMIYPLNTKTNLIKHLHRSLHQLHQLYQAKFCGFKYELYLRDPIQCETKILSAFGQQERLLLSGINTLMAKHIFKETYKKIIQCERGVFRATLFLSRICELNREYADDLLVDSALFHQNVANILQCLGQAEARLYQEKVWDHALLEQLTQLRHDIKEKAEQCVHARCFYYTYLGACQYLSHELTALLQLKIELTQEVTNPRFINRYTYGK